ncbi:MAG TPA: hypothetical protein V6D37_05370 [Candidatus Sericytochromatia bacterium]|jgi:hypothetical protein
MNKLIPLIGVVVLVAALTGAAIGWSGWRNPFLGRRASNQLDTNQNQPATGTRALRTNQPTTTAQNNRTAVQRANQPTTTAQDPNTTTQAPNAVVDPEQSGTAEQSDVNEVVPALW